MNLLILLDLPAVMIMITSLANRADAVSGESQQ